MRPTLPPTRRPALAVAPSRGGFTLIELMVAISVTAVMLMLVSRIFTETTKAINIGADTSQIVSNSRILSDTIFQDAGRMNVAKGNPQKDASRGKFSEDPGGFLVLIQQRNSGLRFPNANRPRQAPENWLSFNDRNGNGTQDAGELDFEIRTDQLAFFSAADKAESITPGSLDRYDSEAFAPYQRIWYGHAPRVNLDGTVPGATEPGQPPAGTDDFDMTKVTDLVLGRQGLLILDDQALLPDGGQVFDANPPPNGTVFPSGPGNNVMASAQVGAFNLNVAVDRWQVYNVPAAKTDYRQVFQASTDVMVLRDPENPNVPFSKFFEYESTGVRGLYATGHVVGAGTPRNNNENPPALQTGLVGPAAPFNLQPTENYLRHALGWAFASPGLRLVTSQDLAYPYEPLDVARNHTFFVPYVSDFAVDFAADITDDYTLADDPNTPDPDNVLLPWWDARFEAGYPGGRWSSINPTTGATTLGFVPDGLPDGRPDEYCIDPGPGGAKIAGIKWYNMAHNPALAGGGINGNPMVVAGPLVGQAADRTRPVYYRLPLNVTASGAVGPFNSNAQIDGRYHTLSAATNAISYPPFVGYEATAPVPPFNRAPNVTSFSPGDTLPGNVETRAVFVFGHTADYDLDGATVGNPFGDGKTTANGFEAGAAKWWPYALRVRYRLHDGDGSYQSVGEIPTQTPTPGTPANDVYEPIPGKWFEQIIPVTHHDNHRPDTN